MSKMKLLSSLQLATQILTFQPIKALTSCTKFYEIIRRRTNFVLEIGSQGCNVNFCVANWKALL